MLARIEKFGLEINTQDLLKFWGIFFVIIDHISAYLYYVPLFSVLGNMAAPIFFFLAGYHHPKRVYFNYLVMGLSVTFIMYLTKGIIYFNILVSFFLIKTFLYFFGKYIKGIMGCFISLFPLILTFVAYKYHFIYQIYLWEFAWFGPAYAFSANLIRQNRILGIIMFMIATISHFGWMHFIPRSVHEWKYPPKDTYEWICFILFYLGGIFILVLPIIFKIAPIHLSILKNEVSRKFLLIISRYSLEIYALNIILSRVLAASLGTYGHWII